MPGREEHGDWSIVMTGFHRGSVHAFTALENAFPGSGIDPFGMLARRAENTPCEIADGLAHEAAQLAVDKLAAGGFEVSVVRSSEIGQVKHRACDVWPAHSCGSIHFWEADGLITTCPRPDSLQCISEFRAQNSETPNWRIEDFLNHQHFDWDYQTPSVAIEEAVSWVDDLSAALTQTYPGICFTMRISLGDVVSFWQTTDDSPREDLILPQVKDTSGLTWCVKCQENVSYKPSAFKAESFEEAEWGECSKCESLLLIRSVERLIFINDPRVSSAQE